MCWLRRRSNLSGCWLRRQCWCRRWCRCWCRCQCWRWCWCWQGNDFDFFFDCSHCHLVIAQRSQSNVCMSRVGFWRTGRIVLMRGLRLLDPTAVLSIAKIEAIFDILTFWAARDFKRDRFTDVHLFACSRQDQPAARRELHLNCWLVSESGTGRGFGCQAVGTASEQGRMGESARAGEEQG